MATHSSILAWEVPWMEEPGGLQSMGSHRVGHDRACRHTHLGSRLLSSEKITVDYSMCKLPYLQYFTNADLHTETQI